MATSNWENIVAAFSTALEAITPGIRPDVTFKRYWGAGNVEDAEVPIRQRAFQFRLDSIPKTPRTLSSFTTQWQRNIILLVVGYSSMAPLYNDTVGYGPDQLAGSDQRHIYNKICMANSLSGVSNVLRPVDFKLEEVTPKYARYSFDIEWAETSL